MVVAWCFWLTVLMGGGDNSMPCCQGVYVCMYVYFPSSGHRPLRSPQGAQDVLSWWLSMDYVEIAHWWPAAPGTLHQTHPSINHRQNTI